MTHFDVFLYVFRIRGISIIRAEETEDNKFYMFTASSDGFIKMFSVILEGDEVSTNYLLKNFVYLHLLRID